MRTRLLFFCILSFAFMSAPQPKREAFSAAEFSLVSVSAHLGESNQSPIRIKVKERRALRPLASRWPQKTVDTRVCPNEGITDPMVDSRLQPLRGSCPRQLRPPCSRSEGANEGRRMPAAPHLHGRVWQRSQFLRPRHPLKHHRRLRPLPCLQLISCS